MTSFVPTIRNEWGILVAVKQKNKNSSKKWPLIVVYFGPNALKDLNCFCFSFFCGVIDELIGCHAHFEVVHCQFVLIWAGELTTQL